MGGNRLLLQLLIAVTAVVLVLSFAFVVYPRATYLVPDRGGTYVEAINGQPRAINPILAAPDSIDQDLASLVFGGLTGLDEKGEPIPELAERWDVSSDNLTYTFKLREGVVWHDGQPFSAEDVVYTIKAIQDATFRGSPELGQLWRNVRVEILDPRTVRFQLTDAYAPFLEYTGVGLLPSHILRGVSGQDLPAHPFNVRPVGTGRFRVRGVTRDELLLDANPRYYGAAPYLTSLRFRFVADNEKALTSLRQQQVQGVRRLAPEEVASVRQDANVSIHSTPDLSKLTLLMFNTRAPLFADKEVRQAIAYGLDRQRLIETALLGQGVPAHGPIAPVSWAAKGDLKTYEHRPDLARQLLETAGWLEGEDGVRRRGETSLSFVILTNDNPLRVRTAEEITRELAQIGIKAEVQAAGWSGFVQDFLVPRRFHAVLTEQWSPNFDPDAYPFWHSSQIASGLNFASWSNRRADDVLENARRSTTANVRLTLYEEFQTIFAEELPGIPLFYPSYNFPLDRSILGVRVGPLVESANRFDHIDEWHVKTKRISGPPTPIAGQ